MLNSQLNKVKPGIKNGTEVTLNLSSNLIGNCNDDTNFSHKLLLTNAQVSRIHKSFANGLLFSKNFSKTQLPMMTQSGGVVFGMPIFENISSSVAKKAADIVRSVGKYFLDKQIDKFDKEYKTGEGLGITRKNNEIEDYENN